MMGTNWAARARAPASSYICTYVPSFPSMFSIMSRMSPCVLRYLFFFYSAESIKAMDRLETWSTERPAPQMATDESAATDAPASSRFWTVPVAYLEFCREVCH
jgi:hypothetical protein